MNKINLIAHRGNLFGPNLLRENQPEYLLSALKQGYSVETDVWYWDGSLQLGHDWPTHPFNIEDFDPLRTYWHCKTISTLQYLRQNYPHLQFFYQEKDAASYISNGNYWLSERCRRPDHYYRIIRTVLGFTPGSVRETDQICTDYAAWYGGLPGLLLLDVDGVLTPPKKDYTEDHVPSSKVFSDHDFTAIKRFIANGVQVAFLSGDRRFNEGMANARGIPFIFGRLPSGQLNKVAILPSILHRFGVPAERTCYIGDDYWDIGVLKVVGWRFCPADATPEVQKVAYTLSRPGGCGVVAELASLYSQMLPKPPEEHQI